MSLSLDNINSSAGYPNSLVPQTNSQQSLLQPFDPNGPGQMYYLRDPMYTDIKHTDSDISLVAQLKHQLAESQHAIASLQADVRRLASENTSLNTTCQTLQNIIINIRGSASSVASSSSLSVASSTSSHGNDEQKPPLLLNRTIEEACDHELNQVEFPSVKSWTKKGWQEQYPLSTSAVPGSSLKKSARGSRRMVQGINVSCTYLQDENGVPVSAQRAKAIRTKMLSCFRQLHTQGLAPESIGQASLDILKWLVHTLRKEYLELRLCADNWKTMRLMTDNYSQWYSYHVKNKGKRVKVESEDVCLEDKSISDSEVTPTTQKRSLSEPDSSDKHITKRLRMDSDITPEITRDPSPDRQITRDPSPDCQPTPLPSTNKGKQKEVVALEVKNPLSNLVIKPRSRPIPLKIPATSTDSSTSASAPNPTIILPSNDTIPTSSMPEVQSSADTASLAMKVELVAANYAAEQMKTTIMIDSKCDTIKKHQPSTKPMRVGAKITPRLSKANKEVYKRKAAAQLISSGQAQGANDNHDD
ncbi:hypothetical protein DFH29DRAFT_878234 [Suillus ampliporus]|nr:hypothetical protein DFH29DRAFT_878234 [Suillus ampliporus]